MSDRESFIVWLSQFGLNGKKIEFLLSACECIDDINRVKGLDKVLKYDELDAMREKTSPMFVRNFFEILDKQNIVVLSKFLPNYPKKLENLKDNPTFLFCKGDLSLLDKPSIAIVGSRKPSNYGRIVCDEFAGTLARKGLVIVSGLAYGIDSISHRKALEVGGKTIAVLGGGFNHIYPSEHTSLADEISRKGLLVSEYFPSTEPSRYTFVERNRIIAGLCDGMLIPEASLTSGTRTTKEFATDYGKDLYAIPGSIKSETSGLPNKLISCGHARCVTSPDDILQDFYSLNPVSTGQEKHEQIGLDLQPENMSYEDKVILELLKSGEKNVEYLQENSGFDIKNLNRCLTLLEIRGLIRKLPGNFYSAI